MVDGSLSLRARIAANHNLISTFVKTPSACVVEILGGEGLDFLVLDAEHAPFDSASIDHCCLAARAAGVPALVRVPNTLDDTIMRVLDAGAAGIVVPHVDDALVAQRVVSAARYQANNGRRGFSNSPRAGHYGKRSLADHIQVSDDQVCVIAQIESREAVEAIDAIVAVDGVDGLLVGRADLAVSLGQTDLNAGAVNDAIERVVRAAQRRSVPLGIFVADTAQVEPFYAQGFRLFIVGSDQSHLRSHIHASVAGFRSLPVVSPRV
jgi:2-keto-3-deoxy-L-rhamnonate aldolase RhmA